MVARGVIQFLGVYLMRARGWIVCSGDGTRWIVIDDSGSLFLTTHVVSLLLICIMTKTLFGATAMKVGLIPDKKKIAKEEKEK